MAPDVHPNCVWLEFLQTWTEDARAKGLKAASAYQRAHRSLAAVTEPFVHPRETVRLPGIGDSIAKRLEKEYAQWCTANGQPIPELLLEDKQDDAQVGKAELIARAQPFCDSDYTVPGGGSRTSAPSSLSHRGSGSQFTQSRRSYITGWSAMKTLIDKAYVYRSGNPPLFYLSEQGLSVARVLAEAEGLTVTAEPAAPSTTTAPPENAASPGDTASQPRRLRVQPLDLHSQLPSIPTTGAPQAVTEIPTEPERAMDRLYLPPRKHFLERPEPRSWKRTTSTQSGLSVDDGIEVEPDLDPTQHVVVDLVRSSQDDVYVASEHVPSAQPSEPLRISISLIDSSPIIQDRTCSSPMVVHSPLSNRHPSITLLSSSPSVPGAELRPPVSESARTPLGCFCLPADSYTIHMIMDHREVRSRSHHGPDAGRRVTFEDAMRRRGVECELRALELGDILWVARPKPNLSPTDAQQWNLVQEVVLDAVVERKRLDDLTSSIFDGRWHDQKDVDVANLVQRHGDRIQTALSSTQIIDGFYVHRSANNEGTADFLANVHQLLQEMYTHQPLHVIRDEMIDREHYDTLQSHLRAQQPNTPFHTSYHTFQSLHGKGSAANTLQDVWTKMLLCIRRVSHEKAQEIVQRWPTPRALHRAWHTYAAQTGGAADNFLSAVIDDDVYVARRKIGQALSKQVGALLRSDAYV
ncbi:MUS81 [Malassezia furfur]|nr:MUS81 [Malassezia furfur]